MSSFVRKHVPDSDPGCAPQSTSMPALPGRNVPNCRPMADGGMGKCSAGACPPLGSGWGVAESAVPIHCTKQQLRLFIPWCAGTTRHGRLLMKTYDPPPTRSGRSPLPRWERVGVRVKPAALKPVPSQWPGVPPFSSPLPNSSFRRRPESRRGGVGQGRHTIGKNPASHHLHPLMRPSQGHGDSCESLPRTPIRGQESRGEGGGKTTANLW